MIKCTIHKVEERTDAEHKFNMPVGYVKMGQMLNRPQINECLYVGSLRTSLIQEILAYNLVKTLNSVYQINYTEVIGLFVDANNVEGITNFFKVDGLYTINSIQYVVGRIARNETTDLAIVPSKNDGWWMRDKYVITIADFMTTWFDAYQIFKDQTFDSLDHSFWVTWKDQNIAVSGKLEGFSK